MRCIDLVVSTVYKFIRLGLLIAIKSFSGPKQKSGTFISHSHVTARVSLGAEIAFMLMVYAAMCHNKGHAEFQVSHSGID